MNLSIFSRIIATVFVRASQQFGVLVAKLAELFVIALVIAVEIIAKIIVTIRMITANIQICIAIRHWHAVHAAGQTKSTPRRGAL